MLLLGIFAKPHGLKGEVKIFPFVRDIGLFDSPGIVYLEKEMPLHIISVKHVNKYIVLGFEEIKSIEELTPLLKKNIYAKKDDLDGYDNYYTIDELLNFEVIDDSGRYIGILKDIIKTGSNDVLVVEGQREIMIPYVPEFVLDISTQEKKIKVHLIKGM